jgi:LacI family transcriptional regulator
MDEMAGEKSTRAEFQPTQRIEVKTQRIDVRAQKRLNLKEIAKLAGVSKSTVSRVLQNEPRVSPTTRERIKTIITELNYKPNLFARGLKGSRTGLIGVLSRWIESGFFAELLRHLDDEVKPRGGRLLCSFTPFLDEYLEQWRMFAQGGQVDGVILVAPSQNLFDHSVQPGDVPMVVCCADPRAGGPSWARVDSVNMRNDKAMTQLIEHLYQQGHRKLAHIAGEDGNLDASERAVAFEKAVRAHGGMEGSVEAGAWTVQMGHDLIVDYIECKRPLPDAFVVFNDTAALGMIRALKEAGLRVPEDVAVTGWDNDMFAEMAGLTTVDLASKDMARKAVGLLFERLSGKNMEAQGLCERVDLNLCLRSSSLSKHPHKP